MARCNVLTVRSSRPRSTRWATRRSFKGTWPLINDVRARCGPKQQRFEGFHVHPMGQHMVAQSLQRLF